MPDELEFPALKEAQGKLDAKNKELHTIFDQAGPELDMSKVTNISGDTKAKVDAIRALNSEIEELGEQVDGLKTVARAAARDRKAGNRETGSDTGNQPTPTFKGQEQTKSIGELFTGSKAYTDRQGKTGPEAHLDIELKALFNTTTGFPPETTRTGRIVEYATRPIQIIDLVPANTTTQAAVVYMEETTFVNNAAETAEGATYPESALGLTEQTSPVRKIATWLPVTDEQLEDEPQARGYINNRLPFMLRQRLDTQILVGNGTAPNLRGFLNTTGIQTQALGADTVPDAIYKAMVKVRVTGRAMPDGVIIHPNDWQTVRLLRTTDGIYIWGAPMDAGPARIWGIPVSEADAITENTALVGDFGNFTELTTRRGVDVQVSNSHSTFFIEGKQAIRADMRVALVVYRPSALCTVTGI